MIRVKFSITLVLIILSNSFMNAQDESVVYNDTVTQKLFQIKKSLTIPFILISGRMQIPVLCFMSFLSSSKLFFMEL